MNCVYYSYTYVCVLCVASKARMNSLKKKKWLGASGLMNTINHYTLRVDTIFFLNTFFPIR